MRVVEIAKNQIKYEYCAPKGVAGMVRNFGVPPENPKSNPRTNDCPVSRLSKSWWACLIRLPRFACISGTQWD